MKPLSQKILLILLSGLALSFAYTSRQYWRAVKIAGKEWKNINKKEVQDEIRKLYQSKLVKKKENLDGSITMVLTDKGKLKALTYKFDEMKIEKKDWDGKWRLLIFDIPEKIRQGRNSLREKIKQLGFYELQKSAFIFPYNCKDEIDFIIEFYRLRKYARFAVLESIDNEKHLKQIFSLL
ncbi:MAG: Repressor in the phenylacetic acid catabolism [Parcubacteria group bacterium GW2011_GWA2_37_10]|nr:MAG: Repressor in the phenylacetic acid catabolism [Parcubacteria group bacterium GW2011_GWA2_37_10]